MPFGNDSPFPLHDNQIRKWSQRGYMMDFLKARASRSRSFECHDFNTSVTAAITNVWTVAAGATATTWAALAEPGGWIRGVTGASVATGSLQIQAPQKYWNGTSGAGFATLIRLSAVTNVRVEMGFAEVLPAINVLAVNTASQAFNSMTTAAVYLYDNGVSASTTVTGLYTVGATVAYSAVATTTNRFDSAATMFVALEIDGSTAKLWLGDESQPAAVKHSALEAASTLLPFIMVKTQAASKNVDIDTIWTWTLGRV